LKFDEFEKKITQAVFVSATPAEFEIERSLTQKDTKFITKSHRTDEENEAFKSNMVDLHAKMPNPPTIVEQIIRPTGLIDPTIEIKPIKNQVDDLIEQVKSCIAK